MKVREISPTIPTTRLHHSVSFHQLILEIWRIKHFSTQFQKPTHTSSIQIISNDEFKFFKTNLAPSTIPLTTPKILLLLLKASFNNNFSQLI